MAIQPEGSQYGRYPEFLVVELRVKEDCRVNSMPSHFRLDAGSSDLTAFFSMEVEKMRWACLKNLCRRFSRPYGTGHVCGKHPATEVAGYSQTTCSSEILFSDILFSHILFSDELSQNLFSDDLLRAGANICGRGAAGAVFTPLPIVFAPSRVMNIESRNRFKGLPWEMVRNQGQHHSTPIPTAVTQLAVCRARTRVAALAWLV